MLSNIRENSSGVLAWVIAILIIIAMAFFGLSSYVGHEPTPVVAQIGDRSIDQYQFRNEFSAWQQQMRQRIGQNQSLDLNSDAFKQQTLNGMINREVIAELVEKKGYTVADEDVAQAIKSNPQFLTDGQFDKELYDRYVASSYGSKSNYENSLRQSLASRQVVSGFGESSFSLDTLVKELSSLQAQKRSFDLVSFGIADLEKNVEVSDTEIQEYYDANIADYQEDERVSIEYVRLSAKNLESEVVVSDEDIKAIYDDNQDSYLTDEKRNVRHILFTGDKAADDAQAAVDKLAGGADFATLAKELSQDPGSAVKGGDLGVIERGQMVAPFEESAFGLEQGVISDPVQSQFGFHVIEVTGIDSPEIPTFEEVKGDIKKEEVKRLSEELFFERSDQLKNIVYENPESLQSAADELNLKIEKTGLFSRDKGEGFTNNPAIRNAAFADSVLKDNNNSEVIEISPTDVVALRKVDFVEQKPKALQQVRAQVATLLKSAKAKEVAETRSEELYAKLSDADWNDVIKEAELKVEEKSASYADTSNSLDKALLDAIFLASTGDKTKSIGRIEGGNGDYYLYRLNSIDTAETVQKDVSDSLERLVQAQSGNSLVNKFLEEQRDKIGVKIDTDQLQY